MATVEGFKNGDIQVVERSDLLGITTKISTRSVQDGSVELLVTVERDGIKKAVSGFVALTREQADGLAMVLKK